MTSIVPFDKHNTDKCKKLDWDNANYGGWPMSDLLLNTDWLRRKPQRMNHSGRLSGMTLARQLMSINAQFCFLVFATSDLFAAASVLLSALDELWPGIDPTATESSRRHQSKIVHAATFAENVWRSAESFAMEECRRRLTVVACWTFQPTFEQNIV